MSKPLPSPELLRKLLRYESETGKLFWRERDVSLFSGGTHSDKCVCDGWNTRHAGNEAFLTDDGKGYMQGSINDRMYFAHRIIWAVVHGEWPSEQIDHINGIRDDNRIVNLRCVSNAENGKNQKIPSNNTSGHVGVVWSKIRRKWDARIKVDGVAMHIGTFTDKADAINARKRAEVEHGFHPNHGSVR